MSVAVSTASARLSLAVPAVLCQHDPTLRHTICCLCIAAACCAIITVAAAAHSALSLCRRALATLARWPLARRARRAIPLTVPLDLSSARTSSDA